MTPGIERAREYAGAGSSVTFVAVRRVLAIGMALAFLTGAANAQSSRPMPGSFADLAEKVSPAVVNISTVQKMPQSGGQQQMPFPEDSPFKEFFERFFGEQMPPFGEPRGEQHGQQGQRPERPERRGVGSGFIIDPEGYIVTNLHVVKNASEVSVTLKGGEASYEAEVLGIDDRTDLALLKVDTDKNLPALEFGDSEAIRVGDWVVAVGSPFGLGHTVTAGIVSARGRDIQRDSLVDFIQIDAPINRGNSGGPLFNVNGEVIGINTAIFSPTGGNIGIGFAIPANLAKTVIDQLRDHGTVVRGWLGVRIQAVDEEMAESFGLDKPRGALIASVQPDSPAMQAGLQSGDVILTWEGEKIEDLKDLPRLVAATDPGEQVEIEIWRKGESTTAKVETGKMPEQQQTSRAEPEEPEQQQPTSAKELAESGLSVTELDGKVREQLGVPQEMKGVVVADVEGGSPADDSGLQRGDVVESIALTKVASVKEAVDVVQKSVEEGRKAVPLLVSREGQSLFVSLRLKAA